MIDKEIYKKALLLKNQTKLLKKHSLKYFIHLLLYVSIPIFAFVYTYFFLAINDKNLWWIKLVVSFLTLIFYMFVLKNDDIKHKVLVETYNNTLQLCGELSDIIDWKTLRKRQIHKPLDPALQEPIDDFYMYSLSLICPEHRGRVIRISLLLLLVFCAFFVFSYSLYYLAM